MKIVRILVVGDEAVGKTSLIERYVNDSFLVTHSPTVINEYVKESQSTQIQLRDSSGLEAYKNIRFLQYAQVDIILMCFNTSSLKSYDNLKKYWLPEIKRCCPNASRILVGCKSDLRSVVSDALIYNMQSDLKVKSYVQCSSKLNDNVNGVFNAALNIYNIKTKRPLSRSKSK